MYDVKEEEMEELKKVDFPYKQNYVLLKEKGVDIAKVKDELKKRNKTFSLC